MDIRPEKLSLTMHSACAVCNSGSSPPIKAVVPASLWDQCAEFFTQIFNTSSWPARWHCGNWTDFHGWLYILSDLSIWASYFAIPFLLFRIINKRKDIPFPKIFWLFIAFILLCGLTHFLDAIIFWWPAYRLSALLRFIAGIVSVLTVCSLYKALPLINTLRTVEQLEAEIEERKKAEQEAKHQKVLQLATQELMQKKDEFMSIASHELKTPITSVKASLQIAQRLISKNQELRPISPFIGKATNQVNKLTNIINDLLDVTKIQAGKLDLVKTAFSVNELIKECVEQCMLEHNDYEFIVKCEPNITVIADRNRIEQVLVNLLTNAIKYSPVNTEVTIALERFSNSMIKFMVTDNGIGIPEDKTGEIFERFFRVEQTSQNFSGLGLGLYISSEIIKRHEGTIGVTSVLGEGSTFWFII
jgi:chemotaxis family two-component system sensor kinase Cph1